MGPNSDSRVGVIKLNSSPSQALDLSNPMMLEKIRLREAQFQPILQSSVQDVEYLHIIYYKWDRRESISSDQNVSIDYVTAISEMEKLDWTFKHNHIGFVNKRKSITIQFVKLDVDKWYVEELINPRIPWDGYVWYAKADNSHLYDMLWRFYHEEPFAQAVPGWQVKQTRSGK